MRKSAVERETVVGLACKAIEDAEIEEGDAIQPRTIVEYLHAWIKTAVLTA